MTGETGTVKQVNRQALLSVSRADSLQSPNYRVMHSTFTFGKDGLGLAEIRGTDEITVEFNGAPGVG